jgi:ADP-L-glycero-D-manno-heptose 6-epimerase
MAMNPLQVAGSRCCQNCAFLDHDRKRDTEMIAVTGAAGFIGSNLAHRLAGMGHDLILVDHPLTHDRAVNLLGSNQFRFMSHDRFLEHLSRGASEIEAMFHLGACSSTTESNWDFLKSNNIEYTWKLWSWCAKFECPFYYASSASTYGDGSSGFDDRLHPSRLRPLNLYGKSKNDFDHLAIDETGAGHKSPPKWAGLKFFNVYGPRESHKKSMASVVWKARKQILETGVVKLFESDVEGVADGCQSRDFVHVEDCIDHMLWLSAHPHSNGLYNSGTGRARPFRDLALAVFSAMGREPKIEFIEMPPEVKSHYQNFTQADMSRLFEQGFAGEPTSLEEGVRRSLDAQIRIESAFEN